MLRVPGWWWLLAAAAFPVWLGLAWWTPPAGGWPGLMWLQLVVVVPLLEELAFRGGLQGFLLQWPRWRGPWPGVSPANGLTALLFAALHVPQHGLSWAAAVLLPGLLFGYCYERGGLWPAIALHVWYNAGYFTLYPPGA